MWLRGPRRRGRRGVPALMACLGMQVGYGRGWTSTMSAQSAEGSVLVRSGAYGLLVHAAVLSASS